VAKVIWTDPAVADLARIRDYIARETQSDDRAEQFCLQLLAATYDRLGRLPDSGASVKIAETMARVNCTNTVIGSFTYISAMHATSGSASTRVATCKDTLTLTDGPDCFNDS
jgi:plasmid stabilization system protein ParE